MIVDQPKSPKYREQLRRFPKALAQLSRAVVRGLYFRGPEALSCHQHGAEVDPDSDGLLERLATFGKMPEGTQCLLKVRHRLLGGRVRGCPGTGLMQVGHGLSPHLPSESVVS